jgi:Holliday junction resolvasome RuvABC endonuclease subunit
MADTATLELGPDGLRLLVHEPPRILGIDPGFASLGLAVLQGERLLACEVLATEKAKAKRADLRVSVDDSRRLGEICEAVTAVLERHHVDAVAIEVFTMVPGKMAGGASKTAMAYGALYALARARGCLWLPLVPDDLKRGLCGRRSASKAEVQTAVCDLTFGARAALDAMPKTKREHAADAIAAAIVGRTEVKRLGRALGRV